MPIRVRPHHLVTAVALPLLVCAAAALRFWGLTWGLPDHTHLFSYHPDEYHSLRGLFALLSGDLNPHFFNYGSLYLYLVAVPGMLLHGALAKYLFTDTPHVALRAWTLDARIVTVVAGLVTVLLVYHIGRRLGGRTCGLWAAGLLAVMPLHVLHSHYGTVDVTQALFVTWCLLFTVKLCQEQPHRSDYLGAGVMAGFAASVKYNGVLVIIAPLLASIVLWRRTPRVAVATSHRRRLQAVAVVILLGAAFAAFAATSPYTFLSWNEARRDIGFELWHMRVGEHPAVDAEPNGAVFHLKNLLAPGMGLILPLGIVGLVMLWRTRRVEGLSLGAFALLWFVVISAASVRYARYEMPLAPVLAVTAAYALARWWGSARLQGVCLTLFALAWGVNIFWSFGISSHLAADEPRRQALTVIMDRLREQEAIGIVSEPWFGIPPLDYCNGGVPIRALPLWRRFRRPLAPLVITGLKTQTLDAKAPEWLVLSEFDIRDGLRTGRLRETSFMADVRRHYRLVGEFGGHPPGLAPWYLASDFNYAWPRIQVYYRE